MKNLKRHIINQRRALQATAEVNESRKQKCVLKVKEDGLFVNYANPAGTQSSSKTILIKCGSIKDRKFSK